MILKLEFIIDADGVRVIPIPEQEGSDWVKFRSMPKTRQILHIASLAEKIQQSAKEVEHGLKSLDIEQINEMVDMLKRNQQPKFEVIDGGKSES